MKREKEAIRVTLLGFFVNLFLSVFKLIAGFLGNSSAMIADAVHSFSDFASDIVVMVSLKIAGKPADSSHDYGHGKFETLATFIISATLLLVGVGIGYEGIVKIIEVVNGAEVQSPKLIAVIAAIVSIISKEAVYRKTLSVGRKINSSAVIANAWHHRTDSLSSVCALIGIGLAYFFGDMFMIFDPIAALVVCFFILKTGVDLLKESMAQFLEYSLPVEEKTKIIKMVEEIEGLSTPHDLKTRKIGNIVSIEMHVYADAEMNVKKAHELVDEAEKKIRSVYGEETNISIHIEPLEKERKCINKKLNSIMK